MTPTLTRAQIAHVYSSWLNGEPFDDTVRSFLARLDVALAAEAARVAPILEELEAARRGVFGCIGLRDQGALCEDLALSLQRRCPVCQYAAFVSTGGRP